MKANLALVLLLGLLAGTVSAESPTVCHIQISGPIGPATASFISRAIQESARQNAQCLILQLDTPGGLLDSTKVIVQELLASPVPVVVYVAPPGATATSAGCFITLAADVAAMAPATSIGAAHPVSMGGEAPDETMKHKIENYASSYIEAIAARRGRNVEWAKSAVRDSASIPADQALQLKVVEILAPDLPSLLQQLHGRAVGGRTLDTVSAQVVEISPSPRERFFHLLWRPEVMFLLMLAAIYGLIGELSNPGAIFPGVVGVIALILVLYMSAVLPINIAGLALVGLAIALFVVDVFAPSHGVLTVGGAVAFFLGAMMMFDRAEPMLRLSLSLVVPATLITTAFFALVVGAGLRAQRRPRQVGVETLVGRVIPALAPIGPEAGKVFVEGEYWNAVSDQPIAAGAAVRIERVEGLVLRVRPGP